MEKSYKISRFEQTGEQLFICINSTNNPVYLEHFFTDEEKLDQAGTIERLVAELELLDESYVAPLPIVSKMEEVKALVIKPANILSKKTAIVAEIEESRLEVISKEEERLQAMEEVKSLEEILEEVIVK